MNLPDDLQPGDILLYRTPLTAGTLVGALVDAAIELKTSGDVAHVEIYHGNGISFASRNGQGVDAYVFRGDGLRYVRRPVGPVNLAAADAWFYNGIKGLPYGWAGLLEFEDIDIPEQGLICSTFADLYLTQGRQPLFADDFPPGKASPFDFRKTRAAFTLWTAPNV